MKWLAKFIYFDILGWKAVGNTNFSQDSIKKLFAKVDIEIYNVLPMKFDAFYVSLLSEKYKNGKMNYFKSFWIGIKSNLKAKRSKEYSSLIYVLKNT